MYHLHSTRVDVLLPAYMNYMLSVHINFINEMPEICRAIFRIAIDIEFEANRSFFLKDLFIFLKFIQLSYFL